jgi:hypothetical protein
MNRGNMPQQGMDDYRTGGNMYQGGQQFYGGAQPFGGNKAPNEQVMPGPSPGGTGAPADWVLDPTRMGGVRPWDNLWKGGADPTHGGAFYRPPNYEKYGGGQPAGGELGAPAFGGPPEVYNGGQTFQGGPRAISGGMPQRPQLPTQPVQPWNRMQGGTWGG